MPEMASIRAARNRPNHSKPAAEKLSKRSSINLIELYAMPRQRSWDSTKRILEKNCAAWLDKEFAAITMIDAYKLLDPIVAKGHGPKAEVTLAWLRKIVAVGVQARLGRHPDDQCRLMKKEPRSGLFG
jgi:hypothetical protein